tara:strand:+ start:511 stop:675 length:165 start_codon:yes stop_codon:yes gene_type:complete
MTSLAREEKGRDVSQLTGKSGDMSPISGIEKGTFDLSIMKKLHCFINLFAKGIK